MRRDERIGLTLQECADRLGVSRERVRQIEVRALRKLRALIEANEMQSDSIDTPKSGITKTPTNRNGLDR